MQPILKKEESETGSSLEIVQGQNNFVLEDETLRYSNDIQYDNNILDYSQQENSITFQVEEENQGIQNIGNSAAEQPKRKRRQIFSKYKKNTQETGSINHPKQDKNFMQTFDEVFHLNERKSKPIQSTSKPIQSNNSNRFSKKSIVEQIHATVSPSKNKEEISIEMILNKVQMKNQAKQNPSTIFQNRISSIKPRNNQSLNDTLQLQNILQTEIFNADLQPKQVSNLKIVQNIPKNIEPAFATIPQTVFKQIKKQTQTIQNVSKQPTFIIAKQNDQKIIIKPNDQKIITKTISQTEPQKIITITRQDPLIVKQIQQKPNKKQIVFTTHEQVFFQQPPRGEPILANSPLIQNSHDYKNIELSQSMGSSVMIRDNINLNQTIFQQGLLSKKKQVLGGSRVQDTFIQNVINSKNFKEQASEEQRFPIYIRKARKFNSYYPNFYHPETQNRYKQITQNLKQLDRQFDIALGFLEAIANQINQKTHAKKQILNQFQNGIKLQYFFNSGWEKHTKVNRLEQLKPRNSFNIRPFDYQKIRKAFSSYRKVIEYYKSTSPNLEEQRGRDKYIDIRKKFWQIQWNIKMISEDLYSQAMIIPFPIFYYDCLEFIKKPFPQAMNKTAIQERRQLQIKFFDLRNQNDAICSSEVGKIFLQKLLKQLKYIAPF